MVAAAVGSVSLSVILAHTGAPPAARPPGLVAADLVDSALRHSPRAEIAAALSYSLIIVGLGLWAFLGLRALFALLLRRFPDLLVLNWRRDLSPLADLTLLGPWRGPMAAPWGAWGLAQAFAASVLLVHSLWGSLRASLEARGVGVFWLLAGTAAVEMLWVAWAGIFLSRRYGVRVRELAGRWASAIRELAEGAGAFVLAFPAVALAKAAAEVLRARAAVPRAEHSIITSLAQGDWWVRAVAVLLAVVVAAAAEELLFRRLLHSALRRRMGFLTAAALSSVLFAAVHMDLWQMPPYFVLGFILAWVYERRGNLLAPVALHAVNNAYSIGVVLLLFG